MHVSDAITIPMIYMQDTALGTQPSNMVPRSTELEATHPEYVAALSWLDQQILHLDNRFAHQTQKQFGRPISDLRRRAAFIADEVGMSQRDVMDKLRVLA